MIEGATYQIVWNRLAIAKVDGGRVQWILRDRNHDLNHILIKHGGKVVRIKAEGMVFGFLDMNADESVE